MSLPASLALKFRQCGPPLTIACGMALWSNRFGARKPLLPHLMLQLPISPVVSRAYHGVVA
eukprot:12937458-Prorocentrum_lima.AAC.1